VDILTLNSVRKRKMAMRKHVQKEAKGKSKYVELDCLRRDKKHTLKARNFSKLTFKLLLNQYT
jgi:hypothetical protein